MNGLLTIFHGFLFSVAGNLCTSNLAGCLSSVYLPWFGIAAFAAVGVIAVLAVIYGISPFVGRSDIRTWVKIKIYDVMLSLVLIMVFTYVASIVYTFPVSAFSGADLVSPACAGSPNIYALSICDMYQFNLYTYDMNIAIYWFVMASGALQSSLQVKFDLGTPALGVGGEVPIFLLPKDLGFKYLGTTIDIIYGFVLANDVQLILLSSSALVFAILMSLGLVARIFGVTRTFGGAMIAFAVGIGIIYPLLVSVNYGFLDYGMSNVAASAGWDVAGLSAGLFGPGILGALTGPTTGFAAFSWPALGARALSLGTAYAFDSVVPQAVFIYSGLDWIGLTFMPLVTLVIVDVFIIDFSQAIGERMSLLSMLERIL